VASNGGLVTAAGGAGSVVLTYTAVVANTSIPTLSEFAMISLTLLMAMSGVWSVRSRGKA
jgi:hypothetical protein